MRIIVAETTAEEIERWNDCVRDSAQGTLFHRYEFLRLMEELTGLKLYPLVGREQGEIVGLFPVFRRSKGPVNLIYSPPHRLHVPYLGPIIVERADEGGDSCRRNRLFLEGCLDWLGTNLAPQTYFIKTSWRFTDPRPFQREGFTVVPKFTYTLDLTRGAEQLKQSFSRSLRRYLDSDAETWCGVPDDDIATLQFIVDQTRRRYASQQKSYPINRAVISELHERLPDDSIRPYVGRVGGERETGIVLLRDRESIYFWSGGGKTNTDIPLNDLIHWQIIRDSTESDVRFYDLLGANTPRICNYKSKFNPEIRTYYHITKETLPAKIYRAVT